ncbi:hypothetical protein [Caulobacter sp.]|uniref:hypothetical protein n=1 Tax=Caulobacter sp. TaxID=78 RepID=UPI001B02E5EB|nr:hypothetical protein [Caulobacter sp.]MBO9543548.1 hypothetical protein [Caulobacter sp.]
MPKSSDDLLKEAEKVANAANLRVAALVVVLVVAGLNIEKKFGVDPKAIAEAAKVSNEALPTKDETPLMAAARIVDLLAAEEMREPPKSRKMLEERAGCAMAEGRAPSETLDVARCIRLYFRRKAGATTEQHRIRRQYEAIGRRESTQQLQRLGGIFGENRDDPLVISLGKEVRAWVDPVDELSAAIERSYGRLTERLSEEIDLDVFKELPVKAALVLAPLAWLLIGLTVLLQFRLARRTFWTLIDQAFAKRKEEDVDPPRLYDMPFWLAPAVGDRGAALLGWNERPGLRGALTAVVVLFLAVVMFRIAWIGSLLAAFTASSASVPAAKAAAWSVLLATQATAATAIMIAVRALVPEGSGDVRLARRRFFGVATAAVGALVLSQQAGVLAQRYWFPRRPRFRARRRSALFARTKLKPGFYQHKRSGAIYLMRADGRLPGANPWIQRSNLTCVGLKPPPATFGPPASRSPALTVRSSDIEVAALTLWARGRGQEAVDMLLVYCKQRRHDGASDRAVQSPMDLAVGLAIRDGMGQKLKDIVDWAESAGLLTRKRREHWLDQAGEEWRRARWTSTRRVSWGGEKWTRELAVEASCT